MSSHPKTIDSEALVSEALNILESHKITQLVVLHEGKYQGIIHLHDILKEGVAI